MRSVSQNGFVPVSLKAISDYAEKQFKQEISSIRDVGGVQLNLKDEKVVKDVAVELDARASMTAVRGGLRVHSQPQCGLL